MKKAKLSTKETPVKSKNNGAAPKHYEVHPLIAAIAMTAARRILERWHNHQGMMVAMANRSMVDGFEGGRGPHLVPITVVRLSVGKCRVSDTSLGESITIGGVGPLSPAFVEEHFGTRDIFDRPMMPTEPEAARTWVKKWVPNDSAPMYLCEAYYEKYLQLVGMLRVRFSADGDFVETHNAIWSDVRGGQEQYVESAVEEAIGDDDNSAFAPEGGASQTTSRVVMGDVLIDPDVAVAEYAAVWLSHCRKKDLSEWVMERARWIRRIPVRTVRDALKYFNDIMTIAAKELKIKQPIDADLERYGIDVAAREAAQGGFGGSPIHPYPVGVVHPPLTNADFA